MKRDPEKSAVFSRRVALIGGGQALLFLGLAARLGYLQVIEQDKYKVLSDQNRINMKLLPGSRGEITDRFGVPLAINTKNFRAFLIKEQSDDEEKVLKRLAHFIPLSAREIEEVLITSKKNRPFTPVLVKENLNWEEMAKIEVNLPDLPGIFVDEGKTRYYPFGSATSHVVGYVGLVSEAELTNEPVMSVPGFRIGKTGIEKKHDLDLRGLVGRSESEVNVVGREVRELSRLEGRSGQRLVLTLDAELQMACQERLAQERSSSAVVMDARNGEILALCSYPAFDPNVFSSGISAELWEELLADPASPLTNKVTSGQYPPGSTFKMVTAMAALETGAIGMGHSVFCPGYYKLGDKPFHCWRPQGHGTVGMVGALEQSCDTFFYDVARKVGIDEIAKMARKLGLGSRLGIDLPNELPGLIPDSDWKMATYGEKWQLGETLVSGIGQSYVQATPLQLAVMTARLVNGGVLVKPVLTRAIGDKLMVADKFDTLQFKKEHIDLVLAGMSAVCNSNRGTAYGSRIKEAGFEMGGKTGTAQVRRITLAMRAAGVKNETLPWTQRHHALFVGYGPTENPKYVVSVVVEHGVGGAKAAAPIGRDLLLMCQKRDPASKKSVIGQK